MSGHVEFLKKQIELLQGRIEDLEDQLEEADHRPTLYRCVWENGDVSIVFADSEDDAYDLLDEVGEARHSETIVSFVESGFAVHFTPHKETSESLLDGEGPVDYYTFALEGFGEGTEMEGGSLEEPLAKQGWETKESIRKDCAARLGAERLSEAEEERMKLS